MLITKLRASFIHLLLSMFIVGAFITFALLVWYPQPFFASSGLKDIVLILLSVDLILGPLLTFVVFKPNKPSLKFDLSFIAVVQIAALTYGMYTIYQGHPVYVAYAVDRFTLISAADVNPNDAKEAELRASGWWKPIMVYAETPSDPKEQEKLIFEVLSGKPDIDARPEYYQSFEKNISKVLTGGIKPEKLLASPLHKAALDRFLTQYGKTAIDYAFLPLMGKEDDVIWVWDKATGKAVDTISLTPWNL